MPRAALRSAEPAIRALVRKYGQTANKIVSILRSLDPLTANRSKTARAKRAVNAEIEAINRTARVWAKRNIHTAYTNSRRVSEARMSIMGIRKPKRKRVDRHAQAEARLMKITFRDLFKANRTISRIARRYCNLILQAAEGVDRVAEVQAFDAAQIRRFISRTVGAGLAETSKYNAGLAHLTSRDIAARIRERLVKKISGGNFITIRGKDGKERNYNLRSYSELVARTRMAESQTEAVKEICAEYDNDLVEIPKHDNPCPEICKELEGKIYSISGRHAKYPKLPDGGPPWHPNCEHRANPTSEAALEWRGR